MALGVSACDVRSTGSTSAAAGHLVHAARLGSSSALGIDYNIFLMTGRVQRGGGKARPRRGACRKRLSANGGVSPRQACSAWRARDNFAADRHACVNLPGPRLASRGGFGVVLGCFVVRSVLSHRANLNTGLGGHGVWWPSKLSRPSTPELGHARGAVLRQCPRPPGRGGQPRGRSSSPAAPR